MSFFRLEQPRKLVAHITFLGTLEKLLKVLGLPFLAFNTIFMPLHPKTAKNS